MTIIVEGGKHSPTWETLQAVVRESLGFDERGMFTRIARPDGRCNYRAHGAYVCEYVPTQGDALEVRVIIR